METDNMSDNSQKHQYINTGHNDNHCVAIQLLNIDYVCFFIISMITYANIKYLIHIRKNIA